MVIGVYDSGLGGLSVWREVKKCINRPLVYFGDTAHVPYGEKTPDQLMEYFQASLAFFQSKGCQGVVVACNTTSAVVLPRVASSLRLPVWGMIESAVEAVAQVTQGRIGVLATQATADSGVYQEVLSKGISSAQVIVRSAPKLVPLIEQGIIRGNKAKQAVVEYLAPLMSEKIDTLLLGCTHYSFLAEQIREVAGNEIRIVDPAPTVAKKVRGALETTTPSNQTATTEFWVSAQPEKFQDVAELVLGEKIPTVNLHPMSGERM